MALSIARAFGTKWLEHQFSGRLEALKHDHQTEVEQLRYRIAGLLDRSTKLNQREFEVLPDIWAKIDTAHRQVITMIAVFQEVVDLSRMGDAQLEEFIDGSALQGWQKEEIKGISSRFERTSYYSRAIEWIELHRAAGAVQAVNEAVSKGGIYINPETFSVISEFTSFLTDTLLHWRLGRQLRVEGERIAPTENDPVQQYRRDGSARFAELGDFLRFRYWHTPSLS